MTTDLLHQIRAYASDMDESQRRVTADEVASRIEMVREVPTIEARSRSAWNAWMVAAIAALVALLLAIPLLLGRVGSDEAPATDPTTVPTTVPTTEAASLTTSAPSAVTGVLIQGGSAPGDCPRAGAQFGVVVMRGDATSLGTPIDYPTFGHSARLCLVDFEGGGEAVGPVGILVTRIIGASPFYPATWPHAWFSRDGSAWTVSDIPVPNRDTALWTPIATQDGFLVVVDLLDEGDLEVWRTVDGSEWTRLGRFDVPADPSSWTKELIDSFASIPGEVYRDAQVSITEPILGPSPRFVTADLGDRRQPTADTAGPSPDDLQSLAPSIVVLESFTIGEIDGTRGFVVTAFDNEDAPIERVCTVIVRRESGSNWFCGPREWSTSIRSSIDPEGVRHLIVFTRNASVSVIAVSTDDGSIGQWQRPFGGAAIFAFDDAAGTEPYQVTMYDAVGNVLESATHAP